MVFFTCNSCGESLKLNKVDKHWNSCRFDSVSCVDCGKDFGEDYHLHNQCVSEDQKYGGVDYKPKENSCKGKAKQEEWIQTVKTAINESNSSKHIKDLMQRLVNYDNIPRKKPKFLNFVRNCLRITNDYYGQQMWDIFEKSIKSDSNTSLNKSVENVSTKRQLSDSVVNGSQNGNCKKRKQNDSKSDSLDHNPNEEQRDSELDLKCEESETTSDTKPKTKINKIIVEILTNAENNEMSLKKLKKKVLKKHKSIDENYNKEKIESKFEKIINKKKKIVVNEGKVSLK